MNIDPLIQSWHAEMTAVRRDIHAHPELGFEEERTSAIVAEKLREYGCEVTTGIAKTGGGHTGPEEGDRDRVTGKRVTVDDVRKIVARLADLRALR